MSNLTELEAQTLNKLLKRLAVNNGFTENALVADVGSQIATSTVQTAGLATQGSTVAKMFHFENPAAKAADDVHVAFRGDLVPVDPTAVDAVTITSPVIPRNLRVTMAADWDGGNVKVYGTDQFDAVISETFLTGQTVLRVGLKAFKTVTKITKASLGVSASADNNASVGSGDALGVTAQLASVYGTGHLIGTGFDSPTLDVTYNTVTFATAPNGARDWNLFTNIVLA